MLIKSMLRRSDSEKLAFVGNALGRLGSGLTTAAAVGTEVGGMVVKKPMKFAVNAIKNDPTGTAMTVGMGAVLGPTLAREATTITPEMVARTAKRNALASQIGVQNMRKVSSVLPSRGHIFSMQKAAAPTRMTRAISYADAKRFAEDAVEKALKRQADRFSALEGRLVGKVDDLTHKIRKSDIEKANKKPFSKIDQLMSTPGKLFLAGAMLSAGAAAGGGIGLLAGNGMGRVTEAYGRTKGNRQFNAMLKADPSLRASAQARTYFKVIQTASPYVASEPYVAAATVRSMLESPEGYATHPKFMQDILGIEERRQKTRFPAMRMPPLRGELPDMG